MATTILPVAYGVILIMISYRYLPIFPQEQELNPIQPPVPADTAAGAEAEKPSTDDPAAEDAQQGDLQPAEA